jgi:uncharacterized repeat protein (TIGR01451 family)
VGTFNSTTGIWYIPSLANGTNALLNITGVVTSAMVGNVTNNTVMELNQTEYTPTLPTNIIGFYTKIVDYTVDTYAYSNIHDWYYNVMIPFATTVKNNAAAEISNVVVNITLPSGMEFLSAQLRSGDSFTYNSTTGILTWNLGNLPGNTLAIFEYTLANYIIGPHYINATANGDGLIKTASWNISTPNSADVEISQTASNYSPQVGETFTITITAKNNGPNSATNYRISNVLSGLTLISEAHSKGSYTNGLWNIGTLTLNETETLTLTVRYDAPGSNSVYRNATNTHDWNATNNGQTIYF